MKRPQVKWEKINVIRILSLQDDAICGVFSLMILVSDENTKCCN